MTDVAGRCPMGCGSTLFLGSGGHVTCSLIGCPDPCAADRFLFGEYDAGTALRDVFTERLRQERLKAEGRFKRTCADPEMPNFERFAVLGEEFGEVARASLETAGYAHDGRTPDEARVALRKELAQVAAVAVAWLEGLDREGVVA